MKIKDIEKLKEIIYGNEYQGLKIAADMKTPGDWLNIQIHYNTITDDEKLKIKSLCQNLYNTSIDGLVFDEDHHYIVLEDQLIKNSLITRRDKTPDTTVIELNDFLSDN